MILGVLGTLAYIIFFIIIPGIGAVHLRRRWAAFRDLISVYTKLPVLEYHNIKLGEQYSFKGRLESIKADNILWLKGESLSININLKDQDIYTVSHTNESIYKTNWTDISSIIEGTQFIVFGFLTYKNGNPFLTGNEVEPLLVILSENEEVNFETLLVNGRDKNELWNSYSPYSYITGVLLLIIFSYFSYKTSFDKLISFYLLLIAGTPFYFIIPPGLIFYLKYRKLWDKSVRWSILSDLKKFRDDYYCADKYRKISKSRERVSLLYYLLGYICNISIAGVILYTAFQVILFH